MSWKKERATAFPKNRILLLGLTVIGFATTPLMSAAQEADTEKYQELAQQLYDLAYRPSMGGRLGREITVSFKERCLMDIGERLFLEDGTLNSEEHVTIPVTHVSPAMLAPQLESGRISTDSVVFTILIGDKVVRRYSTFYVGEDSPVAQALALGDQKISDVIANVEERGGSCKNNYCEEPVMHLSDAVMVIPQGAASDFIDIYSDLYILCAPKS